MEKPDSTLPPETENAEQEDESSQAQTVGAQAGARGGSDYALEDSEKAPSPDGEDEQDLVDHMKQMNSSGTIDMSAYRGEENMDDFEGKYGKADVPDEGMENDDS